MYQDLDEELNIYTSPALYRIGEAVYATAKENKTHVGILTVRLDCTERIISLMGGYASRDARTAIANRMKKSLPDNAILGRGSDCILALLEGYNQDEMTECANALSLTLNRPYKFSSYEFELRPRITVSDYPGESGYVDISEVSRVLASFMDITKVNGTQISFLTEDVLFLINEKQRIDQEMINAIKRNEFHLVYQPRVNLRTGDVVGCEALIRWQNEILGTVSPAVFIPRAEITGFIHAITSWVTVTAGISNKQFKRKFGDNFTTGVNLSPVNIRSPGLPERIEAIIKDNEINPKNFDFEVTETLLLEDSNIVIETLSALRSNGAKTALDDFGTGFSALSLLSYLPLDYLKIDQVFTQRLDQPNGAQDIKIVRAIRDLGHACGLGIIAEGMETQKQVDVLLNEIDVSIGQGYYFGKPVPLETFMDQY